MSPEQQKEIARRGGQAPHRGPRGFAAMNKDEVKQIAHRGGVAEHHGPRGFAALSPEEKREIARRGGTADHHGPRGFAAMDPQAQREIARRGGEAPHRRGVHHEFDTADIPEESDQWTDEMIGGHGGDFGGGRRGMATRARDLVEPAPGPAPETRGGGWDDPDVYAEDDEETEFEESFDDAPRSSAPEYASGWRGGMQEVEADHLRQPPRAPARRR